MFGLRRIESIAPRHASDRSFTGEIVIVDVRTPSEYAHVRVPGAIHIPAARRRPQRGGRRERLARRWPSRGALPGLSTNKEHQMTFVTFMNSGTGRAARIIAGLVLTVLGLTVIGGTGGIVLAVAGLVPLAAGLANVCLFGPLLGVDLHANAKAGAR